MAQLIYLAVATLDGYYEDTDGNFDWGEPDEEVHSFVNDLVRAAGTYLYGRRMYETMMVWETDPGFAAESAEMLDFMEIWQAAEKVVYSKSLHELSTSKTQLERNFDPAAVRQMKEQAKQDLLIGGPELAAHAFHAGLIDECQLLLAPVTVGGGKPALPKDIRLKLELLEERRFSNGMVYLRYRVM